MPRVFILGPGKHGSVSWPSPCVHASPEERRIACAVERHYPLLLATVFVLLFSSFLITITMVCPIVLIRVARSV